MTLHSRATVRTDAAERYSKQLAAHLGRRCEVERSDSGTRIVLQAGDCLMVSTPVALELRTTAPDEEGLSQVEDVVGRHLERFGARAELSVQWQRGA